MASWWHYARESSIAKTSRCASHEVTGALEVPGHLFFDETTIHHRWADSCILIEDAREDMLMLQTLSTQS